MTQDISPARLMRALTAAHEALAALPADADELLRYSTIEGESGALELMDSIAASVEADELLVQRAKERIKRLEARAERRRGVIGYMLEALELPSIERPLYTASLSHHPRVVVLDQAALPDEYRRTAPDMAKLGTALRGGEAVPGATLSNGPPVLTLRTR